MPSCRKPADDKAPPPEHETATDVDWAREGVLPEAAVLSDLSRLRPARVPDDVYALALALDIDSFERSKRATNEPKLVRLETVGANPVDEEPESSERTANENISTWEDKASPDVVRALAQLSSLREDLLRDAEAQLVELAGVIAQRVVARELQTDASFVGSLVKEGVAALADGDRVNVRLGRAFWSHRDTLLQQLKARRLQVQVIVDDGLAPSGCVIETTFGRVDESLESRFDVLMQSLRPEPLACERPATKLDLHIEGDE